MASKKPAKPIAGQSRDKGKELPGKAVLFYGMHGAEPFRCPTCSRAFVKGIFYEENNVGYCKRGCIPKKIEA